MTIIWSLKVQLSLIVLLISLVISKNSNCQESSADVVSRVTSEYIQTKLLQTENIATKLRQLEGKIKNVPSSSDMFTEYFLICVVVFSRNQPGTEILFETCRKQIQISFSRNKGIEAQKLFSFFENAISTFLEKFGPERAFAAEAIWNELTKISALVEDSKIRRTIFVKHLFACIRLSYLEQAKATFIKWTSRKLPEDERIDALLFMGEASTYMNDSIGLNSSLAKINLFTFDRNNQMYLFLKASQRMYQGDFNNCSTELPRILSKENTILNDRIKVYLIYCLTLSGSFESALIKTNTFFEKNSLVKEMMHFYINLATGKLEASRSNCNRLAETLDDTINLTFFSIFYACRIISDDKIFPSRFKNVYTLNRQFVEKLSKNSDWLTRRQTLYLNLNNKDKNIFQTAAKKIQSETLLPTFLHFALKIADQ